MFEFFVKCSIISLSSCLWTYICLKKSYIPSSHSLWLKWHSPLLHSSEEHTGLCPSSPYVPLSWPPFSDGHTTKVSAITDIPGILAGKPREKIFYSYCFMGLCLKWNAMDETQKEPVWYNDSEEVSREKSWREKKREWRWEWETLGLEEI